MMKTQLLKKVEAAIDDAERQRTFGTLEIEFRAGEPVFIRKMQTEKLDEAENRNAHQPFKR